VQIFTKGDRVVQPQYGPGTIADTNAEHTVVDFDNHGSRMFITSMVALEPTNEPAPNRPHPARPRRTKKAAAKA
jgi:hypothetical protein